MAGALVDGVLLSGDVSIAGSEIVDVGLAGSGSGIAIPGLIDLQVNGFAGVDFLSTDDDDAWRAAGERLLASGVTAHLPTLITAPPDAVTRALRRAERLMRAPRSGARILGVHLEGPFLSPERLGTHPPEHRRDPDLELLNAHLDAGPVAIVTLAPELDGAAELIDALGARGVAVSIGHSLAPAALANAAFDRGARAVTHIFNAMAPIRAREPGVAGVALARDDVTVLCIADGVHLADETLRLILAAAPGRVALTSDAIAAARRGEGTYTLGTVTVTVSDGRATRADGTLAGGLSSVIDGLRHAVRLGATLEQAADAAAGSARPPARPKRHRRAPPRLDRRRDRPRRRARAPPDHLRRRAGRTRGSLREARAGSSGQDAPLKASALADGHRSHPRPIRTGQPVHHRDCSFTDRALPGQ